MSHRPRLFIGNFDFERSLALRGRATLPESLERLNRELAPAWLAIAEPHDLLFTPGRWDDDSLRRLHTDLAGRVPRIIHDLRDAPPDIEIIPWGWSQAVVDQIEQAGLPRPPHPPLDVVRYVNSRAFSADRERIGNCELPGAALVRSPEDLDRALHRLHAIAANDARLSDPWEDLNWPLSETEREQLLRDAESVCWVLKANWSNSARERILGQGREITPAVSRWLRPRLARDQVVAFEPWVEIVAEVGIQWDVPREGRPQLLDVVPLLADPSGRYRGSDFTPDPTLEHDWQEALYATFDAAEAAQRMGYFGPLGIDACLYRAPGGRTKLRPLQDINARWTMGRLSLGWRRMLQWNERGVWRFRTTGQDDPGDHSTAARIITTSPTMIDQRPCSLTTRIEISVVSP
jgi:hypothetical protein